MNRYLGPHITQWLNSRMVFIGGPRQVGKTYLAKTYLSNQKNYLSWDDLSDRSKLKKHELPLGQGQKNNTLVIDEIHKYSMWRTLLKGVFDKSDKKARIIVTGSARLDHFRKGGDSLFGRYHYLRLHPLSLNEIKQEFGAKSLELLMKFGGFPEPFIRQSEDFLKIWQRERTAKVVHQDLRDITSLKDYSLLEVLADALPSRAGSLLSYNSLAEDLGKSPHTIESWIGLLESVYHCYRIFPFGPPKIKAIKKQSKLYLWDWSVIEQRGIRFENFVASQLLKFCHFIEDTKGDSMELRFLRDQFGREIDFIILKNKKPFFAVECKTGERALSPSIIYYQERTNTPKFYQVHLGTKDYGNEKYGRVLPFEKFCELEGIP